MVSLKHLAEMGRDALWQKNWHATADSHKLYMLYRAQPTEQIIQLVVAEKQSIATGKQHVAHLGVPLEIAEYLLEIRVQLLLSCTADHSAARAVAAIGSAPVGHQEKHTIRISMHQTLHRHMRILAARIAHFVGSHGGLLHAWDHLPTNRAIGVDAINQIKKMRGDCEREFAAGKNDPSTLFRHQLQPGFQLLQPCDPIAQLPFPIVPLLWRGIGPLAGSMRDEIA